MSLESVRKRRSDAQAAIERVALEWSDGRLVRIVKWDVWTSSYTDDATMPAAVIEEFRHAPADLELMANVVEAAQDVLGETGWPDFPVEDANRVLMIGRSVMLALQKAIDAFEAAP